MSREVVQFVEMVRAAAGPHPPAPVQPHPPAPSPEKNVSGEGGWRLWCGVCGRNVWFWLVGETALDEVYECDVCGDERWFRVR